MPTPTQSKSPENATQNTTTAVKIATNQFVQDNDEEDIDEFDHHEAELVKRFSVEYERRRSSVKQTQSKDMNSTKLASPVSPNVVFSPNSEKTYLSQLPESQELSVEVEVKETKTDATTVVPKAPPPPSDAWRDNILLSFKKYSFNLHLIQ